jgi:GxxExxY protein
MRANEISYKIIGAAMKVHTALGPGLLESAYEKALAHELKMLACSFVARLNSPSNTTG